MQPAITDLSYIVPSGGGTDNSSLFYIDTARSLSRCNRRLYEQGRIYGYQGLTFIWRQDSANPLASIEVQVRTAGNTWITQNAFVKGKALWNQMQDLVLDDNPSIAGKWHDFKIRLCDSQISSRQLDVRDGLGAAYLAGEWQISKYVMPQHEVDLATGEPLPAVEYTACLTGPDSGGSIKSLTQAYEESRATVQAISPNVPAGMSTSFFNLLTDSGSQEPELADVIEDENDQPPYDTLSYPGGALNGGTPVTVQFGAISASEVDGRLGGFIAPCGLLEISVVGRDASGTKIASSLMPELDLLLHVAPGAYKGVAAIPMGQ